MKESSTQQQIQKLLSTQTTFKRNKRYYDIPQINNIQKTYSIRRRKPNYSPQHSIQQKMHTSFKNSKINLKEKVQKNINKYKDKTSLYNLQLLKTSQISNQQSPQISSPKINGVKLSTTTSRDYFYKLMNKPIQDQRLFANFKIQKPDPNRVSDFGKIKGRDFNFALQHITDLNYNTQKLYQQNNFRKTTTSCKFNYKLQKPVSRYFFPKRRQSEDPATDLNPQKVRVSFNATSNFTQFKGIPFYFDSGRQLPCQIELRQMSPNRDYWRNQQQKFIRPEADYTFRKLKEGMVKERAHQIRDKKKNVVDRSQVCDEKYFKMVNCVPLEIE